MARLEKPRGLNITFKLLKDSMNYGMHYNLITVISVAENLL